jgi:hypothetical protein
MSLSTRSGLPAYDATTLAQARAERDKFLSAISHLQFCADFDRLIIPDVKQFLKHDIVQPLHPIAQAVEHAKYAEEEDRKAKMELKGKHECGEVTDARYAYELERLEMKRLERLVEFDKSPALKDKLKRQKKKCARPFQEPTNEIISANNKDDNPAE